MVRDLLDVCSSLSDHLNSESPMGFNFFLDENILNDLNRHNRLPRFIVDLAIPWYVNFYAGWTAYARSGGSVQWIHYEDMVGNELATISSILTGAGLEVSESEIQRALDQPRFTRMNAGIVGRGRELAREHPEVAETLERYLSYYPDVDFRPIYDPTRYPYLTEERTDPKKPTLICTLSVGLSRFELGTFGPPDRSDLIQPVSDYAHSACLRGFCDRGS